MEIQRRKLNLVIDGQAFELAYPSIKLWREYQERMTAPKANELDVAIGFLSQLGLPKEVSESLELGHISSIINELTALKKS